MKRNIIISLAAGIAVSAVMLYLAFKNVPFADLVHYLISVDYLWLLPCVLIILLAFVLRAFRWRTILGASVDIPFKNAYHPLMIGFMINCVLPGRVGEVARPMVLKKKENVPFSAGLATVAAERTFDLAFLCIFFVAVSVNIEIDPQLDIVFGKYHLNKETLTNVFKSMLILFSIFFMGIVLISIKRIRTFFIRILSRVTTLIRFSPSKPQNKTGSKAIDTLERIAENITSGFLLIRQPRRLIICAGQTVIIWLLHAFSYYLLSLGCPGIGLSFVEVSAVMIIICFFISLPSVPGFWGLWEAGGVYALALFGISSKDAAGYTLVNHVMQIFPVIVAGLVSALITGVNVWKVSYKEKENADL